MTKAKPSRVLPIILMVAPTVGIIVTIFAYSIVNFIVSTGQPNGLTAAINIVLFLFGGASIIAFLPCMIIGIVLLVKKPRA